MSEPTQPPPGQPQQFQVLPWGFDVKLIGEAPQGKVAALVISRQMGEQIVHAALLHEIKAFAENVLAKCRELDSGLTQASPAVLDALQKRWRIDGNGKPSGL